MHASHLPSLGALCIQQTQMEESAKDENIATCPICGMSADVTNAEPYAKILCPGCETWMRVRQHFANYEITGLLGEGGQGLVYRGVDNKLKRNVAIKLMKREYSEDPIFVKRFESEAQVTASLNHPNIVKIFSFGEDRGLLYLAMEVVDHGSLDALMAQITKVPEDRVLEVGIQIANGLQAGLEKGLIHRDIKPGNILFADEHTAKIVDFGLAVLVEKQSEEEGEVWATPYYVSPEKLDGKAEDFRSDMYSLAATLFHAIAGRPPFIAETNSIAELKKIKSKPVHLASFARNVSEPTAHVIDKALAARPSDRWASYAEFIGNLEYARNELRKGGGRVRQPRVVASAPARRHGGGFLKFLLVAAIAAGAMYFYNTRNRDQSGKNNTKNSQSTNSKGTMEEAEGLYNAARKKLINGELREAAAAFRELYADGMLPEPRHSWSAVHEGLTELLDGHPTPARRAFRDMSQKLSPNAIGMDQKLVSFLRRIGKLASGEESVAPSEGARFDSTSYEAIGLLILGLKNWENGAFADGSTLLREFQASNPAGDGVWVGEYKPLVKRYLEEYAAYRVFMDDVRNLDDVPKLEAALKGVDELKTKIKTSRLLAAITEKVREIGAKMAEANFAARAEAARKAAMQVAAEEQLLTAAKLRMKTLCEAYQFAEAARVITAVLVKSDPHVKDRDLLKRRIEWLAQFKDQLIRDLETGYAGPLQRKNGQPVSGGVIRATDGYLRIRVGISTTMIGWNDLTPQSVLAMARAFIRPGITPEAAAERKWTAGVFAIFAGLPADSEALMAEAALFNDNYRLQKTHYFSPPAPEPAPAPQPDPRLKRTPGIPTPEATPAPQPETKPKRPDALGDILESLKDELLNPSRK